MKEIMETDNDVACIKDELRKTRLAVTQKIKRLQRVCVALQTELRFAWETIYL